MKFLIPTGLCAVLFCLVSPAAQGQADETPHTATLKVNARLVVLDVVVTDKKGQPIDDLRRDELHVLEDGKPQTLRTFEMPSAHKLPPSAAETPEQAAAEVFDPAKPANFGQSPTTILVLDQLNTHFADSSFARRELANYLAKQPAVLAQPTSLVTIFPDHFKLLEQFTRDRSKLQHTLDKSPVKYPWQLELSGKSDYSPIQRLDTSLKALEEIAQTYARIPGRKNLIWIGGGFPSLDPESLASNDELEVKDQLKHISNVLLDARMVLYAVDPTSMMGQMTEITDFQQMAFAQLSGELGSAPIDPVDAGGDFDSLGTLTGGRVVRNMNNIATQIATAVDYASHFYTVGYSPTNANETALEFRKIKVTCSRADCVVTTRTGYYAGKPPKENLNQNISYDLSTAAESSVPLNGLRVTVESNASVAVLNDAWIIHVAAPELTWVPQEDGTSKAEVAVMSVSLNKQGHMVSHVLRRATATARAGVNLRDETKMANFEFDAKPAPKSTKMRFVVRDATTGRMGSFDIPLK
jgi:VWFA-related protein